MRLPWRESTGILPWLIIIVITLGIVVAFKFNLITKIYIIKNKEYIDLLSKLITSGVLIVGALLSYLKFFKGRILQSKVVIQAKAGAIRNKNGFLHWIETEIENKGSVAIWNCNITIYATLHSEHSYCMKVEEFVSLPIHKKGAESLIDVNETIFQHSYLQVPTDVYAITFQIIITDRRNSYWSRCITVPNTELSDTRT